MKIYGIKAKQVMAGPGSFAYIAEAEVGNPGEGNVYVTIQEYDEEEYTVSKQSVYGFMAEDVGAPAEDFLEEYTTAEEASNSAYGNVFSELQKIIRILG